MVDDKTTIQVSDELRKRLKVLAAERDISYIELFNNFLEMYDGLKFKNEKDFAKWFECNLSIFGFKEIKEKNAKAFPDYILIDYKNKEVRVETEFLSTNFILHKHPLDVDFIVSVYSNVDEIKGIPVLSLYSGYPYSNMNFTIDDELMKKAKIKAALLGITLKDFMVSVVNKGTEDIDLKKYMDEVEK